jgi:hypothetical protein
MGKVLIVALGLCLGSEVAEAKPNAGPKLTELRYGPRECTKKRVDPCGCHHVYGVRHCHPNRATAHCESWA